MTLTGFHARIDRSRGAGACWPWMGEKDRDGYGRIRMPDGRRTRAHRVALSIALGRPLRSGMVAMHRCDNPPCCNPGHLREGTRADNNHDMMAKGHHRAVAAASNPMAKLTTAQVEAILVRAAWGEPASAIAPDFAIHPTTVSKVVRGESYRSLAPHLPRRSSSRRLSALQVATIKHRLRTGGRQAALAREFGVVKSTIQQIAAGLIWRDVAAL